MPFHLFDVIPDTFVDPDFRVLNGDGPCDHDDEETGADTELAHEQ